VEVHVQLLSGSSARRAVARLSTDGCAEAAIVALTFVALRGVYLLAPLEVLVGRFEDDAFYYFQVARNIARGAGPTFDGIHATNGFHPLWMALLVVVFRFVPGEVAPLRCASACEVILVASALVGVHREMRRRTPGPSAFVAAVLPLAMPASPRALAGGMESALDLFLLVALWRRWSALGLVGARVRDGLALGALAALACLARLENTALVAAGAVVLLRRHGLRCALPFVAVPSLVVLGFAAYSTVRFGMALPVSGVIKHHLAERFGLVEGLWLSIREGSPECVAIAAGVLAVVLPTRSRMLEAIRATGIGPPLVAAVVLAALDLAVIGGAEKWSRVPLYVAVGVAVSVVAERLGRARAFAALVALIAAARLAPSIADWIHPGRSYAAQRLRAGRWLAANLPPGARAGSWNAGMIGYFSARAVINLDGLVNDRTFYEQVIRDHHLARYVDDERIDWLADQQDCGESPAEYLARGGARALAPRFRERACFAGAGTDPPAVVVWQDVTGVRGGSGEIGSSIRADRRGASMCAPRF
jgi:hypothetical protein